jgi:hypothetical protein
LQHTQCARVQNVPVGNQSVHAEYNHDKQEKQNGKYEQVGECGSLTQMKMYSKIYLFGIDPNSCPILCAKRKNEHFYLVTHGVK